MRTLAAGILQVRFAFYIPKVTFVGAKTSNLFVFATSKTEAIPPVKTVVLRFQALIRFLEVPD